MAGQVVCRAMWGPVVMGVCSELKGHTATRRPPLLSKGRPSALPGPGVTSAKVSPGCYSTAQLNAILSMAEKQAHSCVASSLVTPS